MYSEGRDFATLMVPQETVLCASRHVRACYILLQVGDAYELVSQI